MPRFRGRVIRPLNYGPLPCSWCLRRCLGDADECAGIAVMPRVSRNLARRAVRSWCYRPVCILVGALASHASEGRGSSSSGAWIVLPWQARRTSEGGRASARGGASPNMASRRMIAGSDGRGWPVRARVHEGCSTGPGSRNKKRAPRREPSTRCPGGRAIKTRNRSSVGYAAWR